MFATLEHAETPEAEEAGFVVPGLGAGVGHAVSRFIPNTFEMGGCFDAELFFDFFSFKDADGSFYVDGKPGSDEVDEVHGM